MYESPFFPRSLVWVFVLFVGVPLSLTQVAETLGHLAFLSGTQQKEAEQEACLKQQAAVLETVPNQQLKLSIAEQNLGFLYSMQKKYPEAESAYLAGLRATEASPLPNDSLVVGVAQRLGLLYKELGEIRPGCDLLRSRR